MKSAVCLLSSLILFTHFTPALAAGPAATGGEVSSRAAHRENCERIKRICQQRVGPGSSQTHEITHCAINYNHCVSRGDRMWSER